MLLFLVAVTHTRPFLADFADSLKTSLDCAVLVTLVLSILLKLDLEHEAISHAAVGLLMLGANLLLPLGVCAWCARNRITTS